MQTFATKLGIMVHHHEPDCHVKKLGFYLQGQGHSVCLYNQNMTVSSKSIISFKSMSLLQPDSIVKEAGKQNIFFFNKNKIKTLKNVRSDRYSFIN